MRSIKRLWLALIFLGLALYVFGASQIVGSLTAVPRHAQHDMPDNHNLPFTAVDFSPRGESLRLDGWYITDAHNRRTIIVVHGHGDNRSGRSSVQLAARLHEAGFNVLLFDLRAHGSSEGEVASGGFLERRDVLGAIDFVAGHGVETSCIGMLASSAGSAAAVLAAVEEPTVHALVLDSPYADIDDLLVQETARTISLPRPFISLLLPGAKLIAYVQYGIDLEQLTPEETVTRIPYPLLVIHGTADERIPASQSERVHAAAAPSSELWLVNGVGHANAFVDQPDEFVRRVLDYYDSRLDC